jgi:hypothetical protein
MTGITKVRQRLSEWSGMGALFGLDAWVANIDRHERNLLFSGGNEVWLIDHGHCFTGPQWVAAHLDPTFGYASKLQRWLTPALSEMKRTALATAAAEYATRIVDLDLKQIGEDNYVLNFVTTAEFASLTRFLADRIPHLPRLAAATLNINLVI